MEVQLIRNATVKIRYGGKVWLVDPFFADRHTLPSFAGKSPNPVVSLPLPVSEILKDVDYILITHLHPDHFDAKAQASIPKSMPFFVQPSDVEPLAKMGFVNLNSIENEKRISNTTITRVMAQHGEGEILKVMGAVSGYVLAEDSESALYITGDTIWCDSVKSTIHEHHPEVVICNAGGNIFSPESNPFQEYLTLHRTHKLIMDEKQVLEMVTDKSSFKVIAVHIGALDHETVSRKHLKTYLKTHQVDTKRIFVPEDGERINL
ncbi:MBL fold metallo-hydrolase [Labilibaculum euxinus]|uniref:MBL fold metallo-hydrolase n=1 Tax=Labilibaculum euxinus TaxID=2686357 RepID=A0A7M4D945_9BACT|nr:MBL fold metallo-hydrolase [Labilibaculum euxinus]MUP39174.1 MBL fold metallo-hydrolase [Labilibaculum euxinus]MVB08379.1 MBL fold metallo-hydrolase [Labilibaculum euxinus]